MSIYPIFQRLQTTSLQLSIQSFSQLSLLLNQISNLYFFFHIFTNHKTPPSTCLPSSSRPLLSSPLPASHSLTFTPTESAWTTKAEPMYTTLMPQPPPAQTTRTETQVQNNGTNAQIAP
ncbi:hypothetical protein BCIN_09g02150 [Botrytis cinerea B05.10]|uniref:Uncharacterized protein n=1 Tax=Botryotinia fuckeliana (strain B05.10) TaxID=332648 RepID=A0A384JRY0_BOTFB|nr:hypothetical protein BCIN_09g02150 [Botrytis cinerea B05.10]ATZ53346.1 hypothetical protein BCIN_09g02150 [Botrytis cinerea B05.10]